MQNRIDIQFIGNSYPRKSVELVKWHQGPLKDFIVDVYDKTDKKVSSKEDMTLKEARKYFNDKVKELEKEETK